MVEFTRWNVEGTPSEVAYRYEEFKYDWSSIRISLREFEIVKFTPKGMWIKLYSFSEFGKYNRRWIGLNSRKKYACLTKEEALDSFISRKRRQVSILESQLLDARSAYRQGQQLKGEFRCISCNRSFETEEESEKCCSKYARIK